MSRVAVGGGGRGSVRPARAALRALLALAACAAPAVAQDAWVSPKARPTALSFGDRQYEPQGNLRLFEAIRVHPALRETLMWDDNIFLSEGDREGDLISISSASLRLDLLPGDFELSAGSRVRWQQYLNNPDESHPEAVGEVKAAWLGRTLRAEVSEAFELIQEPLNLATAERLERVVHTLAASVRGEWRRVGAEVSVEDRLYDFRAPFGSLDHREDTASLTGSFVLAPEQAAFLRYTATFVDYKREFRNDFQTHAAEVGLRGRAGPKAEGEVAVGVMGQIVEDTPLVKDTAAYAGAVGHAALSWSPTPRWSLRTSYRRTIAFAQFEAYQVVDRGDVAAEWKPRETIVGKVYGFYDHADPVGTPVFQLYGAGLTADYDWQPWLSVGIGIEYRTRETTLPNARYTNLRAWVHLTLFL